MIETYYILRDCCGKMVDISTNPIPHTVCVCETCGDLDLRHEVVRIVRADVSEPVHADRIDLAAHGVSFATIREIDAAGVENVDVVPHNYSMCSDSPRIYGRMA